MPLPECQIANSTCGSAPFAGAGVVTLHCTVAGRRLWPRVRGNLQARSAQRGLGRELHGMARCGIVRGAL